MELKTSLIVGLAGGLVSLASAYALTGFDRIPDDPPCAHACQSSISSYLLACSDHSMAGHGHGGHGGPSPTTPDCRAGDDAYLTTLAWCVSTKCAAFNLPRSKLELFWEQEATGDPSVPPKKGYSEVLFSIKEPPTYVLQQGDELNKTSLASPFWNTLYGTSVSMAEESKLESIFGVVVLVSGFSIPILLTWLGYFPIAGRVIEKLKPYLIYPSTVGTYQVRPLPYLLGNAPTLGQGAYVFLMLFINVLLAALNYQTTPSHLWFTSTWQQTVGYIMYRTGVLAYALLPLLVLFAGRNNILLWLTNWSHSTYLLLHRWIARIFMLQTLVHSVLAVIVYKDMGIYPAESVSVYWAWGVLATVLGCAMLVFSVLYIRSRWYEIFLIGHIIAAIFVIIGCWYHVVLRFTDGSGGGYITWLYAAIAVWAFDRGMRLLRMINNGVHRAKVVDVGDEHVRVDIPGVRWGYEPGKHVYVYFPTIHKLRPWENHPFSVLPTSLLQPASPASSSPSVADKEVSEAADVEKNKAAAATTQSSTTRVGPSLGLTLFIRRSSGMTRNLRANDRVMVLLDGPYPNNPTKSILRCDRVLLIAGGIGVTGILPWVKSHPNVKLAWSVRASHEYLIDAMDGTLAGVDDKEVKSGGRLNVTELVEREAEAGWHKIGVVACGPGSLCDDVRAAVIAAGKKHKAVFELEVDAYTW